MENTKKEKVKLTVIPPNAEITITVGGLFYQRLNKLLIDFGDSVNKDELLKAIYRMKKGITVGHDYSYNLETIIILLRDIEAVFKETGQTIDQELEVELPDALQELKDQMDKDITLDD